MPYSTDTPLSDRLASLRLLLTDVDGVLTDGRLWYGPDGEMLKGFHARDGMAVGMLREIGVEVGIVSGRRSPALTRRAEDLGITIVFDGVDDKAATLAEIVADGGYTVEQIGFIGDDLPDLPIIERVGLSFAPYDAVEQVRSRVDHICDAVGGSGVLREVAEMIIAAR